MSLEHIENLATSDRSHLLCLEVNPPRGTELGAIFDRLDNAMAGIDHLNVTDSALAKMRLAPLPFASILKQRYNVEPMVNISCRDRNLIAIQGDLLAGWVTGIRSIVALTGDAVTIGDSPERKGVFEVNSVGLLNVVAALNSGKDISGNDLKGAPAYFPGVVVNPNAKNPGAELKRLQRKKDAGARYALSQPVFDHEIASGFFEQAAAIGVPMFIGLLPFKSAEALRAVGKIPGIRISDDLLGQLESSGKSDLSELSIDHCLKLAKTAAPYVRGFHVIAGGTPKLAMVLTAELARMIANNDTLRR